MSGQEQFERFIPDHAAVGEFDDGQSVIKELEGSFLAFSGQYMPENEYRLALTFCAQVSQGMLGGRSARKLTGGAGSEYWCCHHAHQ